MAQPGGPGHVPGMRALLSQAAFSGPGSSLPHLNCGV